jgi:NitT/TauT family transport system permease protein
MIHNRIIFVGPWETMCALVTQAQTVEFWRSILASFGRIAGGFLLAFLSGLAAASLASRFTLVREFLEPPVALLQSVPVASFVILALIWIGSSYLSVLITFLVVFPVLYRNVLEGLGQTDSRMMEMADVFGMSAWNRIWYLYRPALMPYLLAGCRISLGMAWKSGVAAEVIGVPSHSIGEKLYMAKIYLSTAELFAWTLVIILVSRLFEKLFLGLLGLMMRDIRDGSSGRHIRHSDDKEYRIPSPAQISIEGIQKSYHGTRVLNGVQLCLEAGRSYCLMGPSGQGKTTLLRILMGLEQPDAGRISGINRQRISAVFQEDRLCEYLDSVDNIRIACGKLVSRRMAEDVCCQLLEEEAVHRPVRELSGGMKRRAAIARALLSASDVILMDEPFAGLDQETKRQTIRRIRENLGGRTLLVVTHGEEDAVLLGAEILRLQDE